MKKIRKSLAFVLFMVMMLSVLCSAPVSVSAANTWDPANGHYNISTEADLFAFRDALNSGQDFDGQEVKLLNDIEISEGTDYISPNDNNVFRGTFNGNNKTISNLNMVSSDDESVSLFAQLNNATINDLTLNDITIENGLVLTSAFAALTVGDVEISKCHITGDSLIKGKSDYSGTVYCAGFVAYAVGSNLIISDCTIADTVTIGDNSTSGSRLSGGFVGLIYNVTNTSVLNCINRANVNGNYAVGGIVAHMEHTAGNQGSLIIENCINYGDLVVYGSEGDAGGIIAYMSAFSAAYIDGCANHGDITKKGISISVGSGGIVGEVHGGMCLIQNTYNTGNIVADHAQSLGGIAGHLRTDDASIPTVFLTSEKVYYPENFNRIINCYNTGNVTNNLVVNSGETFTGGICGFIQDSSSYPNHTLIENAYNFGEVIGDVSGKHKVAAGVARIDNSYVTNTYVSQNKDFNKEYSSSGQLFESEVGYFDTPEKTGKVYPGTINTNGEKTISSTPLTTNLLQTLQSYVDTKNAELKAAGNDYRYKSWKMTNPASEDGSKVSTVHPMFGVLVEQTLKFHVNEPNSATDKIFRVYNGDASDAEDKTAYTFTNGKVEAFYNIPAFAEDDYVFAGWYYNSSDGTSDGNTPFEFGEAIPSGVTDVYAHWIEVGEVSKDSGDDKDLPSSMNDTYKGFELFGVQIRPELHFDNNQGDYTPGGLRFIASISEELLTKVDALSDKTTNGNKVEYGFVTAAESTVETVVNNKIFPVDKNTYKLQYRGTNVNGVDTLLASATTDERKTQNNFRYITNVDCTSEEGGYGSNPRIHRDHQNFRNYRLATFVVTYDDDETGENKGENKGKIAARAYMRYYDANGLLRTFYNDYAGTDFYGGCSTYYNALKDAFKANRNKVN